MKTVILYAVAILLLLCGCKQQTPKPTDPTESQTPTQATASTQPSDSTTPTTPSKPTEASKPTETTKPSETTKPTETVTPNQPEPKLLTVADWQLDEPKYLSYEDYFDVEREFSGGSWEQSPDFWIKGDSVFSFEYEKMYPWEREEGDGLVVRSMETGGVYFVPGSEAYGKECSVIGANGHYGYVRNSSQLLQIDLATGKAEVLLDEQNCGLYLCDNLVVYYATYAEEMLTIGRIYLPTMKKDALYTVRAEYYDIILNRPKSNRAPIVWELKNPEFVNCLKAELKNPDSKYKTDGQYDYSEYWEAENGLQQMLRNPLLLHKIQDDCGIRVHLKCTLDLITGNLREQTGIIDTCSHGSGYPHDHYNTEITTAPDPTVIMSPWTKLDTKAAELLHRASGDSPKTNARYAVITDVDSSRYLYAATDGDYKKIVDTPVSWVMSTGTCMIYATVDEQTLFAVSYDGTQNAKLLQATRGGFLDACIREDENYLVLRDGDTLLLLDLVNGNYRKLVSHPYLRSGLYFDGEYIDGKFVDTDKFYFVAYEGLYVGGFTFNIITGEMQYGYRL